MISVLGYQVYMNDAKLAAWNAVVFFLAFFLPLVGTLVLDGTPEVWASTPLQFLAEAAIFAGILSASTLAFGLDSRSLGSGGAVFTIRLALGVLVGGAALLLLSPILPDISGDQARVLAGIPVAFLATLATRQLAKRFLVLGSPPWRIIIVGTGESAVHAHALLSRAERPRYEFIGYYRVGTTPPESSVSSNTVFDSKRAISDIASEYDVQEIIVALDDRRGVLPIDSLLDAKLRGVQVTDLVSLYERECCTIKFDQIHPSSIIFSTHFRLGRGRRLAKRVFDVLAALAMLIVAAPIFLFVVVASLVESRGRHPVFYRQDRVGYEGRIFRLYKFRSMIPDAEGDGKARWAGADDKRVTTLGKFLRRYRIDELPQLFNVLVGDMSLVGPRPERPEFVSDLARKIPYYKERHYVPPGLTGWAQLLYPYGANIEDAKRKLEYDLYYIKHTSVVRDFVILLRTFEVVVSGRGAR